MIAFAIPLAVALLATPPPPPPELSSPVPAPAATAAPDAVPSATPTPIAVPSGFGMPSGAPSKSHAMPTPPPSKRNGLDGVWEVEIQIPNQNLPMYAHIQLKQEQNALSGLYLDSAGKKYPLSGTLDGESVRLVATRPDGTTILLEAKLDGTTDMLGMFTDASQRVPFTAAYRPKENFFENISPAPGGIGGGGGAGTGGGIPPK